MLLPIGAYMVSGPTGKKNLERNLSRLVQYSTVLLLMCLSHRNHDQKKRESTLPLPTARAPVYSAAFWLLNDRIVKIFCGI